MYGTTGLVQLNDFFIFIQEMMFIMHDKQKFFVLFNLSAALLFIFLGFF